MVNFYKPKNNNTRPQKHLSLEIEKYDYQGSGIAFNQGKPVFVPGAMVGEKVVAQPIESKSKFIKAKLIKLLQASDERIEPFCPHFHQCGGCSLQHMPYQTQLKVKQDAFIRLMAKVAPGVELALPITGSDRTYRRRARISVLWEAKTQQLQFGFRQELSKKITSIRECPVLAEPLAKLLPEIKTLLEGFSQPKSLGHVELVLADNHPVMLLRTTQKIKKADLANLKQFAQCHHLALYLHQAEMEPELVVGTSPTCNETGFELDFLPTDFIQVNREVNQKMVENAIEWLDVSSEDKVLDLFSGVGNFTFPLSAKAKQVVGVEGVEDMVHRAQNNAQALHASNVSFYQANLANLSNKEAWAQQHFNKVLLDPARAGASGVVEKISEFGASSVVYVSCNPATLARDSWSLLDQGYRITKMRVLDMFPHTGHLESMVLFEK